MKKKEKREIKGEEIIKINEVNNENKKNVILLLIWNSVHFMNKVINVKSP